jgi:hypothetical protein
MRRDRVCVTHSLDAKESLFLFGARRKMLDSERAGLLSGRTGRQLRRDGELAGEEETDIPRVAGLVVASSSPASRRKHKQKHVNRS